MHTRKQARELLKKANAQAKKGLLDAAAERAALTAEIDAWQGAESNAAAMAFEAVVAAMTAAKRAHKAAVTPEERATNYHSECIFVPRRAIWAEIYRVYSGKAVRPKCAMQ